MEYRKLSNECSKTSHGDSGTLRYSYDLDVSCYATRGNSAKHYYTQK